jgi:hypothetical protein
MKIKWVIFITIIVLWFIGGVGILIQINQTSSESDKLLELIKSGFLILGGLGVILPTYLNIWQSLENSKIIEERIEFDKVENAFRLIEKWDDNSLLKARQFTREIKNLRDSISNNELIKRVEGDAELKQSVIMVFNYWEQIRLSIERGRVNESLIKSALACVFIDMYERFKPWINTNEEYRLDIKKLYDRWSN